MRQERLYKDGMETISITPLQRAVAIAGGQVALATKLGLKQGHVWWWLHRAKKVPAERCMAIERATGGKVTRYQLRPDVFGPAPDTTDEAA